MDLFDQLETISVKTTIKFREIALGLDIQTLQLRWCVVAASPLDASIEYVAL